MSKGQRIDPLAPAGGSIQPPPAVAGVSRVQGTPELPDAGVGSPVPLTTADVAQSGNLPVAEANMAVIQLRAEAVDLRDRIAEVQAELGKAVIERDAALAKVTALEQDRDGAASDDFDPSRPHIAVERFTMAGDFGTLAVEANQKITDPFVLRRLHHGGAKLARIPA